jgi:uncharacterized Tic20 family protein
MSNVPSIEDRTWAVISHLSAVAFGMGILLPIIGWAEQRRKSNYASFQCLQALGYQSLGYTIWLLLYLVVFIVFLIILVAFSFQTENTSETFDPLLGSSSIIFFILIFGFLALYLILPIIAAIACALGRDFRYPIMGNRLARYLEYDTIKEEWMNENHEHHWVAAMGHFAVIIALWGMLAPLTTWLTQGKQSLFLKFQSIQTLIFQSVALILYFVALFVYLFGIFLVFATMGLIETQFGLSSANIILILFGVFSLVAVAIFLVIPMLHILGQWAGYRVLKGDDYRYPLIGKLVERWIVKQANSGVEEKLV